MDLSYHLAALREVLLLVSGAQSARGAYAGTATQFAKLISRDLTIVLLVLLVALVPAMATAVVVMALISQMFAVVQI